MSDSSLPEHAAMALPRAHWGGRAVLERHFHGSPYAALVLDGSYEEAGDHGRITAQPGHVLFHWSWSAHRNIFAQSGAHILNLPLSEEPPWICARVADLDSIVRLAERDKVGASALLLESSTPSPIELIDWPDVLARAMACDPDLCLGAWAYATGVRPETVSRGFRLAFGVTAARFRRDIRTGRAVRQISATGQALADIAASAGFADQSHMTRAVKDMTGLSPAELRRRSIPFKAARRPSA